MQQVVATSYGRFGKTYRSHPQGNTEYMTERINHGADRTSRNVGKGLPLLAA